MGQTLGIIHSAKQWECAVWSTAPVSTPNIPTTNIGFEKQVFGANINTWGAPENTNWNAADSQLGGKLALSVSGNQDVTLTAAQALFFYHVLTGTLTGNINYIVPNLGRRYIINNQTTGNFTITIIPFSGDSGVVMQNTTGNPYYIVIDPTDGRGVAVGVSTNGAPSRGNIASVSTNYAVQPNDQTILCNASLGAFAVTLPSTAQATTFGRFIEFKKTDSSANTVTISGDATIDGAPASVLYLQNQAIPLQCATAWEIL